MRILALDTATEACSVACLRGRELIERHTVAPREHARRLLPWVDAVLAEAGLGLADLDAIAISRGPGSFTGIRIGFSAAQGLAVGAGLGLIGVSSLAALAETARQHADPAPAQVITALDARMGELYAAAWQRSGDGWEAVVPEQVVAPGAFPLPPGRWWLVGPGVGVGPRSLAERLGERAAGLGAALLPRASAVARLAARRLAAGELPVAPEQAAPVYLRNRVTWETP